MDDGQGNRIKVNNEKVMLMKNKLNFSQVA